MLYDAKKIPKPDEPFKIVDDLGHTLNPTKEGRGFMVQADRKLAHPSGLSTGMTIALSVAPMTLTIILAIVGYLVLFSRADATTSGDIKSLEKQIVLYQQLNEIKAAQAQKDIDEIKSEVREMNRGYQEMRELKAKIEGVKGGLAVKRGDSGVLGSNR